MKTVKIFIATIIAISTLHAAAQDSFDELIAVPLSSPGDRGVLDLDIVNGSIEVKGYDGKQVLVKAVARSSDYHDDHKHKDKDKDKDKDRSGLKRIPSNSMEVAVSERNNKVSVESNSWKQPIDFEISVPMNFDVHLSTVNAGDIRVENIKGNVELNNVNGKVTAEGISGAALIDTVNGEVKVSFNEVTKDVPMAFTTLNGDIEITLPATTKATFKMKTDRGEIFSDFDMALDNSGPTIDRSGKGNFKVKIENWVYGKVNGGGPEFLFNNMNGDIVIRKK
ncbi:MAG: DUF4097 family beta strand repeat-containing protein [Cyclobacteriaceae bacterium]